MIDTLNAFDYDGVAEIYNNPAVDASTFEASGEIIETYGTFSYGNVSYVADKLMTDRICWVIQIANYEKGKLTFTASFFEDSSVAGFRLLIEKILWSTVIALRLKNTSTNTLNRTSRSSGP